MSKTLDSNEMAVDIPPNPNPSASLEKTETSDASSCLPDRLQKFLKGNVKALGVAQIMIGVKCILYGIIGFFSIYSRESQDYRMVFYLFYTGFPVWAAFSFIISGSLAVVSVKKQTKSLLRGNVGANIVSTLVSMAGIFLLLYNLSKIFQHDCDDRPCIGIKSIATGIEVILMILVCVQLFISLPLSMLTYRVEDKNIGLIHELFCWKPGSEGPYQDLLPQTSIYQELDHKDTTPSYGPTDTS